MSSTALLALVGAGGATALAFVAAWRARRALAPWTFVAGMLVLALENAFVALSSFEADAARALSWQHARALALAGVPATWLLFSVCYARRIGRWRWRDRAPVLVAALLPVGVWIWREQLYLAPTSADAAHVFRLGWSGIVLHAGVLLAAVAIVLNLERTFRAAVGTMRWRIKFMLLGAGTLFVARIYTTSQILAFRGVDDAIDSINSGALIIGAALMLRSLFRAGHFDLDVYPSQSVLQKSLTILLAGIYLLTVGILAEAVTFLGGDEAFALKAFLALVALVALAVVIQSDHARLRLRKFVSRHFQRPFYDYRTVWQKFAAATVSRVEQPDLTRAIATLVGEVFQALSVSVWLVNDQRDSLVLAASTSASADARSSTGPVEATAAIAHFAAHPDPVDLELAPLGPALVLRTCHPRLFETGGNRACLPLVSRGQLLGFVLVGDRVGGGSVSLQDLEMLRCIGEHAAASLMNIQLSQRLLQSRELEAFQAMAAFFVHDLKNAASTLNLMLKNLPVHFDNPQFRADALRGIAKTVTHINGLIGRLTALRHQLKTELADADLNAIVNEALSGVDCPGGPTVVRDLQPLPSVPLDRDQFQKVVTNLVLNAAEAVAPGGRIRIATAQERDWVVLTVEDNGCGMTPEFMHQALFRPFQTTKKSGLGIGMFQSKMIVEAHGGRIAVSSESGRGTTFQVFLRASATTNPAATPELSIAS